MAAPTAFLLIEQSGFACFDLVFVFFFLLQSSVVLGNGLGAVRKEKTILFFSLTFFNIVFEKIFMLLGFCRTGKYKCRNLRKGSVTSQISTEKVSFSYWT